MRRFAVAWLLCVTAGEAEAQAPTQPLQAAEEAPRVDPKQEAQGSLKDQKPAEPPPQPPQPTPASVPKTPAADENGESKAKTEQGGEQGTEFWPPLLGVRLKITDSIIAIFTALLAVFTYLLWRSTDKLWRAANEQGRDTKEAIAAAKKSADAASEQVRLSRLSFENTERAYILLHEFKTLSYVHNGKVVGLKVIPIFKNTGSTVATNVVSNSNIDVRDGEEIELTHFADRQAMRDVESVAGPGGTITFNINISIEDALRAADLKSNIFIYGWVEYEDVMPNSIKRRSEFCVKVIVSGDPCIPVGGGPGPLEYQPVGPYNRIDEHCYYKPGSRPPVIEGVASPLVNP